MNILQVPAKISSFSKLGENCQTFEASGTIFEKSGFLLQNVRRLVPNIRSLKQFSKLGEKCQTYETCFNFRSVKNSKVQGPDLKLCHFLFHAKYEDFGTYEAYEGSIMNSKSLRMNFQNTPFEYSTYIHPLRMIPQIPFTFSSSCQPFAFNQNH